MTGVEQPLGRGDADADIIHGDSVTVSLGGKAYVWNEPNRRQSRAMLRRILSTPNLEKIAVLDEGDRTFSDIADLLGVVDDALDFFYEFNLDMAGDKEQIDESPEVDIVAALRTIINMVVRPFVKSGLLKETEPKIPTTTNQTNTEPAAPIAG